MSASAVSLHPVLQLLWTATAASLTVCVCFALALRAAANASAARQERRAVAAFAHVIGAGVPLAFCLAAIAAGVLVLLG